MQRGDVLGVIYKKGRFIRERKLRGYMTLGYAYGENNNCKFTIIMVIHFWNLIKYSYKNSSLNYLKFQF